MIVYAATVILSACLLFLAQPLITKMIFAWFGGTSAVWTTALMFFQVCLLCGYSYAHWLTVKVSSKRQAIVHGAALLAACTALPIIPSDAWRPDNPEYPAARIFLLLTANVGLPSLVLSATSPLLQAWYTRERGRNIPFWLFALSNAGSLAALLSFPFFLEPAFSIRTLAVAWSAGFVLFAALCLYVTWNSWTSAQQQRAVTIGHGIAPDAVQMTMWVLFAASASALLGAATVQLSVNVAPIPLLWVVPLAVYLLTFILNFSSRLIYRRGSFFPFVAAALGCLAWLYANREGHQDIRYVVPLYLICLFVICMACHGELVQRAPAPAYLTRFYLLIALGGALGGTFVAVIAPLIFDAYLELPLLLVVLAELMIATQWQRRGAGLALWPLRIVMVAALLFLAGSLLMTDVRDRGHNLLSTRNFYGTLVVREYVENGMRRRSLVNGTIRHGYQFVDDPYRELAGSYYDTNSGAGRALRAKQSVGPVHVGVIGLGAGILTSYARKDDDFTIYEINEHVTSLAEQQFSFLSDAKARGARLHLLMSDARLALERQQSQQFDVLIVDAFSSDAIPTHLLTQEAFALYFLHLKSDGVLAVHISNRYLNLAPLCQRAAEQVHRSARLLRSSTESMSDASDWVLIPQDDRFWRDSVFIGASVAPIVVDPSFRGWSDQYSSLWSVLSLNRSVH